MPREIDAWKLHSAGQRDLMCIKWHLSMRPSNLGSLVAGMMMVKHGTAGERVEEDKKFILLMNINGWERKFSAGECAFFLFAEISSISGAPPSIQQVSHQDVLRSTEPRRWNHHWRSI
ncbi:hypothetical protein DMENIID0001_041660 [Sergentomyia squamirostris]